VAKNCTLNYGYFLGELESISPTYYVQFLHQYFCTKKVQTLNLSTKKLRAKLLYKKAARKMLVKLTLGGQANHLIPGRTIARETHLHWAVSHFMNNSRSRLI
jgi:hypothetical protein